MVVIRFLRVGKKNQPVFRIVVIDKKNPPKSGRFIEVVGFYNPLTKEKNLKAERIKYWLSVGAQPSDTVHNLLISEKIIEDKKIPLHKKKKPSVAKVVKGKGKSETLAKKDEIESPKKEEEKTEIKEEPAPAKASAGKEEKPKEPEKPREERPEKSP